MFVGHLGLGLLAKRIDPKISLGTWMLAVMLADFLVYLFLIAGIEHIGVVPGVQVNRFVGDMPYSHSLLMGALWAALFAGAYFLRRRYPRGAWLLFAAVLSHWVLDVISHRPDMALAPGLKPTLGLGLWSSLPATLVVEGGFWVAAVVVYVRTTRARNRWIDLSFWAVISFLTLSWYGNITAGVNPDPVRAGLSGLVFFSLVVAWAYWMNRVRVVRTFSPP